MSNKKKRLQSWAVAGLLGVMCVVMVCGEVFAADGTQDGGGAFKPIRLIKPLGVCAVSCLLATAAIGLMRRKLGRRFLRIHKTFALATVAFAVCHATLIIVLF